MKKLLLLTMISALSTGALANSSIFECTTTNHKTIKLSTKKNSISYSFGQKGSPDLLISIPKSKASTYQWQGFGRYENYAINVPNGNTTYRVFHGFDKINQTIEAGVEVIQNGNLLVTIYCSPQYKIINNMIGVDLKPEDI
ncbi:MULTISPECIES: hypothetical protein [unclassified Acinetobacter]|uniref:hypothetical protein n=1 Tax=unclassified Acinetobacter TaxID=196816 RepID=UPI0029344788|nr:MULTISPECIES: hypothetical protein [unclassified Acinetobacter]WOE32277.1 hypothetical protein QSG84_03445 [Acinetobacter sp. SAAs470]WOE37748.1 hypothetical protein QSG86_12490 [Acinetobacter sp. SAAs474]